MLTFYPTRVCPPKPWVQAKTLAPGSQRNSDEEYGLFYGEETEMSEDDLPNWGSAEEFLLSLQSSGMSQSVLDRFQSIFSLAEPQEEEKEEEPFTEPLPLINPPKGCLDRVRSTIDYKPLPNSHSIRLLKLTLPENDKDGTLDQTKELIKCSLMVVDLDLKPDYFALSYTWGDPRSIYTSKEDIFTPKHWSAPAFAIIVDGKPVTVGTNLYTALMAIRYKFITDGFLDQLASEFQPQEPSSLYIWIDALCINQDDFAEKGSQVAMMARIYRQARATIMWLGGGEPMISRDAAAAISKFAGVIDRLRQQADDDELALWERCASLDLTDPKPFKELGLEPISHQELVGWHMLLSRTWFTRAWVVQEWVLSRNCMFLCGSMSMHPRMLWEQFNILIQSGWRDQIRAMVEGIAEDPTTETTATNPDPDRPALYTTAGHDNSMGALIIRLPVLKVMIGYDSGLTIDLKQQMPILSKRLGLGHTKYVESVGIDDYMPPTSEKTISVEDLSQRLLGLKTAVTIEDLRDMISTDPRDKVFAFSGLFEGDQANDEYPKPDYSKSVAQVYIEATKFDANKLKAFFLSAATGLGRNPHQLPTWATDFSQPRSGAFLENSHVYSAAAGLSDTTIGFLEDGHVLSITGHLVDIVRCVQSRTSSSLIDKFKAQLQVLSNIPESSCIQSPPEAILGVGLLRSTADCADKAEDQSRFEVLWRTLCMDASLRSGEHPLEPLRGEQYMGHLKGIMSMHAFIACQKDVLSLVNVGLEKSRTSGKEDAFTRYLIKNGLEPSNFADFESSLADGPVVKKPLDRDTEYANMVEMNGVIAMLEGSLFVDSKERPIPDSWKQFQKFTRDALDALEEADYQGFADNLKEGLDVGLDILLQGDTPALDDMMQQRNLFATTKGRLGLDLGGIREGDEIWLVPGLHAPIALRQMDKNRHQVVGCIYVHGIMYGEAAPLGEDGTSILLV